MTNNHNTTDVSISDIDRIAYADIDKKLTRLSHYINRVHQRLTVLNRQVEPHQSTPTHDYINHAVDQPNIKVNK